MILDKLVEERYHELNENDLYIWQYILHHKRECQKMSIKELAHECNVSHTSILRFTKKLGLEGFSELKIHLKWDSARKSDFKPAIIEDTYHDFLETIKMMKARDFTNIMEMIDQAERIFVYGTGVIQNLTALELRHEFIHVNKILHLVGSGTEIDATLNNVTKKDIFIIISFSGDNEIAVTLAKALKGLHVKSIGISRKGASLLTKYCDEMIDFHFQSFSTGICDVNYTSPGHFFIIANFLFLRYLEYVHEKNK